MSGILPIFVLLGLFVLNVPVAFAIAAATLLYFMTQAGLPTLLIVQRIVGGTESFPLLAVPFFIMAGVMMNYAGITRRLMDFAEVLSGHMIGGLAQVNVLLSTFMGGLSGSSNADAAVQSKILVPQMQKRGYSPAFAASITAASALIAPIIPPGIGLIIFGFLADVSIGKLFLGGIVPGIFMCGALMVAVRMVSRKRGYLPEREHRATLAEFARSLKVAAWALVLPLAIIGGIRFGVFTPTEAGAMAVVYAVIVGVFVYRELKWKDLPAILTESLRATAVVMLIVAMASAFGWYLSFERLPQTVVEVLTTLTENPTALLMIMNVSLLILGCFVEGTASLIILTPLLMPVVTQLGIDPVHFGVVMVVNLTIGGITPPLGTVMYTVCSIIRVPVREFSREVMPFLVAVLIVLVLITYIPNLVLFLPNWLMG